MKATVGLGIWEGYNTWVGLRRIQGIWTWLDGTTIKNSDVTWQPGFPLTLPNYNCALINPLTTDDQHYGTDLGSYDCTWTAFAVCEIPLLI